MCTPQGAYYMTAEHLWQLYRSVLPIVPWVHFLLEQDGDAASPPWFADFLVFVYVICKVSAQDIFSSGRYVVSLDVRLLLCRL